MDVLNRFDLNLLVVFEAVYAERGVSRAAARLCLTQSAVSHSLRRLRELLHNPLFTRQGNVMIPNRTADQLIGPVRLALDTLKASLNGLEAFDPADSTRRFRIGVRGPADFMTVPPVHAALRRAAPHATLAAAHHEGSSLEGLLRSGSVDLAVDVLRPNAEGLGCERLGQAEFVVLLREGHPVLTTGLDLPAYRRLDHIVATTRRSGLGFEDVFLRRSLRGRRIVLFCQSYAAAALAVATTDAVLTLPRDIAAMLAGPARLVIADLFPDSRVDYAMYWSPEAEADPAVVWFRDLVRTCARARLGGPAIASSSASPTTRAGRGATAFVGRSPSPVPA
jgi:DNA-binding transcriptional LysR family regulator